MNVDFHDVFMMLPTPKMVMAIDDPTFTIVAENDAHARLLPTQSTTYSIGKGLLEAYPDTSELYRTTGESELVQSIRAVIKTGKPDSMQALRYDLADDKGIFTERWWRATHYPVKDADGAVIQVLQDTRDITDEFLARRELDQTETLLEQALSVGLVSSFIWNIDGDLVTGDRNLADMFGVPLSQVKQGLPLNRFLDSIYEDDRERVAAAIQSTIQHGTVYEIEYRTYRKDKSIAWVIARGTVQQEKDDERKYFVGILIDITARKDAEEALEAVKHKFDALFQSTVLGIGIADTDGRVLECNHTFLRYFGYTQKEFDKGLTSTQLTAPRSRSETQKLYQAIRENGESAPIEKEYVRKDGSTFSGLVGAVAVPTLPNQFIAFILDVSENRRLKELNAAKDEFIAQASHQLRTPLTTVKQYLGILLEGYAGKVPAEQREYLQTAYESNDRELGMVNDLLKTARIDAGSYELAPRKTDIVKVVQKEVDAIRPACDLKQQPLAFHHPDSVTATIDSKEMGLAIANLLENAHKYSPSGTEIAVSITIDDSSVLITVADKGVGISDENQAVIFDKFRRVSNPLSVESGGTGLGLYWVRRIVQLHGGTIDVTSEIGKGSRFTVHLPL